MIKLYLYLMSLRLTQFAAFWCPENHPKVHVEGRVWRVGCSGMRLVVLRLG